MKWLDRLRKTLPKADPEPRESAPDESLQPSESRPLVASAKGQFVCRGTCRGVDALYLVDRDGRVIEQLACPVNGERFGNFAVSANAKWVAYTCDVPRGDGRSYPIIRAVPTAGGPSQEVESWNPQYKTCYQNPVFSAAGDKMICEFGLGEAHNPDLRILNLFELGGSLRGSSSGLSIVNPLHIGNHAPRFMADGKRVVYFSNFAYEDLLEVCLYDPANADSDVMGVKGWRLTYNGDGVWRRPRAIAVQPEWEQIFFIQGHSANKERVAVFLLSDIPPAGYVQQFDTIGEEHNRIGALDISSDGLHLLYDADAVIYFAGTDGSGLRRISTAGMDSRCPQFSSDGKMIAYIGRDRIHLTDTDSGTSTELTREDFRVESFVWT